MNISGIYAIKHVASARKYIGSAINISSRWSVHKSHLNAGKHHSKKLQRSWDKYGANEFSIEIIEEVINAELLIAREQFYLDQIDNFRYSFNCNPTAGSSFGRIFTNALHNEMSNFECISKSDHTRLHSQGQNQHTKMKGEKCGS